MNHVGYLLKGCGLIVGAVALVALTIVTAPAWLPLAMLYEVYKMGRDF